MRFFVVTRPEPGSHWDTEYMPSDGTRYGDAPRCAACGVFTAMREWLPPCEVTVRAFGKAYGDFAFFSRADFLTSDHATNALRSSRLHGIAEYRPVATLKHSPAASPPPRYFHPILTKGAPRIDRKRTVLKTGELFAGDVCDVCLSRPLDAIGAVHVDTTSWNNEDMFIPRGLPGMVIVTERFEQLVGSAELTGVTLVPVEEHRWDPLGLL